MPNQLDLIEEAYNRGILPEEKKPLYEEAVRRGLLKPKTAPAPAPSQQSEPTDIPPGYTRVQGGVTSGTNHIDYGPAGQPAFDPSKDRSTLGNTAAAALSGFGDTLGNIGLRALETGANAVGATDVADRAARARQYNPFEHDAKSVSGVVGGAAGQMVKAVVAGPTAPAVFAAEGAESAQENVEGRRANGQDISGPQQAADVLGHAALGFVMGKLTPGQKTNEAILGSLPALKNAVADQVKRLAVSGGVGIGEAEIQNIAANAITKFTGVNPDQGLTEGAGAAAVQGGLLGVGGQAVHDAIGRKAAVKEEQPVPAKPVDPNDPFAGATFEAPTGTDPETEQRLNNMGEEKAAPADDRPKGDLKFADTRKARNIAEARAQATGKPMYVVPTPDGFTVDSRHPATPGFRIDPDGSYTPVTGEERVAPEMVGQTEKRGVVQKVGKAEEVQTKSTEAPAEETRTAKDVAEHAASFDPDTKMGTDAEATKTTSEYFQGELESLDGGKGKFKLVEVPVDSFKLNPEYQPETAAEYAKKKAENAPPVIGGLKDGELVLVDGNTRVRAAKLRGDATVRAWVPEGTEIPEPIKPEPTPQQKQQVAQVTQQAAQIASQSAAKAAPIKGTSSRLAFVKKTAESILTPINSRIRDVSAPVFDRLMRMEFNTGLARENELRQLQPKMEELTKALGGNKSPEYDSFKRAVLNRDFETAKSLIPDNGGEFDHVTTMLDRLHKAQNDAGVKLGKLDNYWPRYIKDYASFEKLFGDNTGRFEEAWDLRAKALGKSSLSPDEKMEVVNSVLQGFGPRKPGAYGPTNARTRTIENISDEQLPFYMDPMAALQRYVNSSTYAAERSRFLGRHADVADLPETIGSIVQKEVDNGSLKKEDQRELTALLHTRFTADMLSMSPGMRTFKTVAYLSSLGQIRNGLNQLVDVAVTATSHGIKSTFSPKERSMVMEDVGLHSHGEEFKDVGKLAKATDWVLKRTGFTRLDRFGKETRINAARDAFSRAAKNPDSAEFKRLETEYRPVLGDQFDQTMSDLRDGRKTENVRYLTFLDVVKAQPVTLSNMPEQYLKMRNGRILYSMKTFTLQQLDFIRRDVIRGLTAPGERREAIRRLAYLTAFSSLIGVGKDVVNDLMRGKSISPDQLPDRIADSLLGVVGLSRYNVEKFSQSPQDAALNLIVPPFALGKSTWQDVKTMGDGSGFQLLKHAPWFGELAYYWLGKGADLNAQEAKKDYRSKLRQVQEEAYHAKQQGDLSTARELLAFYNDRRKQGVGDGKDKPLSLSDLDYAPPASPESKVSQDFGKKAIQALKAGDVATAREQLKEYNRGRRNKVSITDLQKKIKATSQQE